ncbi:GNAT family N-acetyltransferase [Kallotenue papyrolyticum]|uniref:GNAT family N-acetyltransferase n=1 Tax=Kallotenue papyrolyticum TaxID=1325125 RepID=UPI0004786423|nr:GNAT family N-acetyltransferase [Kallotenue papyrolyticum]
MSIPLSDVRYRRTLGDGLLLRWSIAEDTERIAALYSYVFRDKPDEPLNERIALWTRDLLSGRHPLIGPHDFAVVEDTRDGRIVASTCLLEQTWRYEGIATPVGRPEIVASLPGYRNRGLIRAIFELIHARSAAREHLALGITGIPYYYRQFGYEYALDLGGSRRIPLSEIPRLKEGASEPYRLRPATAAELPLVRQLYAQECAGTHGGDALALATQIPEEYWAWVADGQTPATNAGWQTWLVVDTAEVPVGYVLTARRRWDESLAVRSCGFRRDLPLTAVWPSVLRGLAALAQELPVVRPNTPPATRIALELGREHPLYAALNHDRSIGVNPPYAWYVRVPDVPRFVRHVAPALEERLSRSAVAGYSGELTLNFYRDGLRLVFEQGRLAAAEQWRTEPWGPEAQAGFPPLVFLQLLFGHRSLAELRDAYPDVWANHEAATVLEAIFPKRRSWVLPLD